MMRSFAPMRAALLVALIAAACGPSQKAPVVVAPPPRDLGPEELGPVPPELRHVETDAYSVEIEAPPSATVKERVQAKVLVKAKPGLAISTDEWKLSTAAPRDVDVEQPVL